MKRQFSTVLRDLMALAVTVALAASCSTAAPGTPGAAGTGGSTGSGGVAGGGSGGASGSGGAPGSGGVSGTGGGGGAVTGTGGTGTGTGGSATDGAAGAPGDGAAGDTGGAGSATWPGGAVAAVTLTYDDGLDSQVAQVAPLLDTNGLKGTFFLSNFEGVDHQWALPNLTSPLDARHLAWMAAGARGHELAGHTVNHPCNAAGKAPNYKLTDYTLPRMTAELDNGLLRMKRLGASEPFTFAYPCSSDTVGLGPAGTDYSSLVAARFFAARVSMAAIADPATVDLLKVPQLDAGGKTGDELKVMVDQAITRKGWLVLLFHGVGNEASCAGQGLAYMPNTCTINYLTTSSAAHQALVTYLAVKKTEVWTGTFKQVAQHIRSRRP